MTDYQYYGLLFSLFFIAAFIEYKWLLGAMVGITFTQVINHSGAAQAFINGLMGN